MFAGVNDGEGFSKNKRFTASWSVAVFNKDPDNEGLVVKLTSGDEVGLCSGQKVSKSQSWNQSREAKKKVSQ